MRAKPHSVRVRCPADLRRIGVSAQAVRSVVWVPLSLLLVSAVSAQDWEDPTEEAQRVEAGSRGDGFGVSVAMSGNLMVIGAHFDDDDLEDDGGDYESGSYCRGSAYVFRFSEAEQEWEREQRLTASDGDELDFFGYSVAIHESVIIVGAHQDEENGLESGSAYVFRYDEEAGEWLEEQKLVASDGTALERFGSSTAVHDGIALVGAPQERSLDDDGDVFDRSAGAAYVFRYDEETGVWEEEQKLVASDRTTGDEFGTSVAVFEDTAIVGSPLDDGIATTADDTDSGAVYVFRYDEGGEEWEEDDKIAADGARGDRLGRSVSLFESVALIGASHARSDMDDPYDNTGAAYVFRYDGAIWVPEQKLTASDGESSDHFGWSVSLSEARALVGSLDATQLDTSAAYAYEFDSDADEWFEVEKLVASDEAPKDYFGQAVACSGDHAIIGAYGTTAPATPEKVWPVGRAYAYKFGDAVFLRGDADGNGVVSAIPDGLTILQWGFGDGDSPPCLDAADSNDSGENEPLPDALFLFRWSFAGESAPPDPGPKKCGADPTEDSISCDSPCS